MGSWSGAFQGALGGGGIGASVGGPIGAGIGGLLGGIGGYFSGSSKSKGQAQQLQGKGNQSGMQQAQIPGYVSGQIQQYTPEQMQLFQQQFGQVGPDSQTARLASGDPSMFDQVEAPAMKQFNALQGGLASRFSGAGTGARRSSGFDQASTTAAQDFAGQLQANRMGLQRQAMGDLHMMQQNLLGNRPYEQYILPQQQSGFQSALPGLAQGIGYAGAGILGLYGLKKAKDWGIF